MFQSLRFKHSVSRQQLAAATGRSVNYILKAEQLTPSNPPVALIHYWATQHGYSPDLLKQQYRQEQRLKREQWLRASGYLPGFAAAGTLLSFRRMWYSSTTPTTTTTHPLSEVGEVQDWEFESNTNHPTQYALSAGLCLPASALHKNETYPKHRPRCFLDALADLEDFVLSGRLNAVEPDADVASISTGLAAIREQLLA